MLGGLWCHRAGQGGGSRSDELQCMADAMTHQEADRALRAGQAVACSREGEERRTEVALFSLTTKFSPPPQRPLLFMSQPFSSALAGLGLGLGQLLPSLPLT